MKLEVTRGIECGERGYGDESGHCRVRGEWDGGVGCGSNRVKLRLREDESEFGGDECGYGHAKGTRPAGILPNPLHPPNNTLPNQSKPIVPTLSPISL